jgi:hypothetical protein
LGQLICPTSVRQVEVGSGDGGTKLYLTAPPHMQTKSVEGAACGLSMAEQEGRRFVFMAIWSKGVWEEWMGGEEVPRNV